MIEPTLSTVPEFAQWINPVIQALHELGGSGKPREVVDRVAKNESVPEETLDRINPAGGQRFPNQVHWARYFLVEAGYIDRSRPGVWKLTDLGNATKMLSMEDVRRLVTDVHESSRTAKSAIGVESPENSQVRGAKNEVEGVPEELPPDEDAGNYRARLLRVLQALTPAGFERLCQRLLREAGFEQVVVTGKSNDGGIDGHGVLSLNAFVSFRVLFQCKRYTGSVTPAQVRDFRGAMQGRADKGLILTTGSFTTEARREASRDGAPPIELVDGDKLVDLFAKLELGLVPATTYEINDDFFAEYRV